ncbi:MAG: TonB-dependent receptor, partial [Methylococcales bacterium]
QEDIKRSGVTNIPDALRMAPGLDVARIDANKWAVSSRGFNGRFANKLLVLIDGRSIYTQAFSGVYWETQDVMMEDIERIEVIRGPGAALWGANAVNGVINIITKHSADSQGGLLTAGGGNKELGFGALRYGKHLGRDTTARIYAKGFKREQFKHLSGTAANDDWHNVQGGFRLDSLLSKQDALTVSGDLYYADIKQNISLPNLHTAGYFQQLDEVTNAVGGNFNSRLEHTFTSTSSYALQFNYDAYNRNELFVRQLRQTVDIDFQHRFALNTWNDVIWGVGYRYLDGQVSFPLPQFFALNAANRKDHYFNVFVQDELTLIDDKLWFTLGSKFEHNDYTGFEVQPTARLMWTPHEQHRFWGAISRAVRTPSLIEAEMRLLNQFIPPETARNPSVFPVAPIVAGNHGYRAEQLLAYELGYRFTFANSASIDATIFYNDYQTLRSLAAGQPGGGNGYITLPLYVRNANKGKTYGFEASIVWQMLDWWRWDVNYSYLHTRLTANEYYQESVTPQHKSSIRAALTPWQDVNLDLWLRYVDKSSAFTLLGPVPVGSYVTMDARLAWKLHPNLELSVTGQNLLDSRHLESVQETYTQATEIPRSVFAKLAWHF